MAKQWAQHTHGVQGTILFISEVKPGDTIVPLDSQSDLGNNSPLLITRVEPRGTTQIEYYYQVTPDDSWPRRVHKNTLVLVVNKSDQ